MSGGYVRPRSSGALRLHLNENTAGCSPRVLEAIRSLTAEDAAFYPDYDGVNQASARRFGIGTDNIVLTNGLDDGLLLTAVLGLRGPCPEPLEAIVVLPAFDMYAACVDTAGGRLVQIAPDPDLGFPLRRVVEAVTPRTRVIFLTNPNNPTGLSIPKESVATIATAAPEATVLLDEAYADFAGCTMIDEAVSGSIPNLIVGRTFAKAYGLAGLRAGALIGSAQRLAPFRRAVLPYTLNVYAAAALPAAFQDLEFYEWYLGEVRESKRLLYESLRALGVRFWPSDANFVLACFGDELAHVVRGTAERGIAIRDRSSDPGCAGCARITAGVTEHTRKAIRVIEEVLCGAR